MRSNRRSIQCLLLLGTFLAAAEETMTQTSSPLLLVLARNQSVLMFVDPVASKVVGRLPTGGAPHEVIASSDGNLAFVSVPNDDNIIVIDVKTQKELRRVNIGPKNRPH